MRNEMTKHRMHDTAQVLRASQAQIQRDVTTRIRAARDDDADRVSDDIDYSDAIIQAEMDFSLIEMKAEALARVQETLARLDTGEYGLCLDCGEGIAPSRLRAMAFAVRCTRCQSAHERHTRRTPQAADRRSHFVLETIGS